MRCERIGARLPLADSLAAVLCPLGGLLLWRSLPAIRQQLEEQSQAASLGEFR